MVAAGTQHDLALMDDGTVWAWGTDPYAGNGAAVGQLGNGKAGPFLPQGPVQVQVSAGVPLTGVIAVAAGGDHSLALLNDGTVWGWGDNHFGAVGYGLPGCMNYPYGTNSQILDTCPYAVPVKGPGGTGQLNIGAQGAISAGASRSLALSGDGKTVWEWGGSIGPCCQYPAPVPGVTGTISKIATSEASNHNLLVKSDGTVWAWGSNYRGELGSPSSSLPSSATPVNVPNLANVTAIATGADDSFAVSNGGSLYGWGENSYGQLGNGTVSKEQPVPTKVPGLSDVILVTVGTVHTLAASQQPGAQSQPAGVVPPPAPPPSRVLQPQLPQAPVQAPVPAPVAQAIAPAPVVGHSHPLSVGPHPGSGAGPPSHPVPHPVTAPQPAAAGTKTLVAPSTVMSGGATTPGGAQGVPVAQINPGAAPAAGPGQQENAASANEYAMVRHTGGRDLPGFGITASLVTVAVCFIGYRRRRERGVPCWAVDDVHRTGC